MEAPQSVEELEIIPSKINGPALVNIFEGGKTPPLPAKKLEEIGFKLGIYPSQTHRAAIRAAQNVLAVLKREGDTAAVEDQLVTFNHREAAVNTKWWRDKEVKYLYS